MSNLLAEAGLEKIAVIHTDPDGKLHVRTCIVTPQTRERVFELLSKEGT